jgi:hypothetical protein
MWEAEGRGLAESDDEINSTKPLATGALLGMDSTAIPRPHKPLIKSFRDAKIFGWRRIR